MRRSTQIGSAGARCRGVMAARECGLHQVRGSRVVDRRSWRLLLESAGLEVDDCDVGCVYDSSASR